MAQRRSTSGSRSSSGKKRTSSSSSRSRTSSKKAPAPAPSSTFMDYFHAFSRTKFFVPVATFTIITALVLLDLLISWNRYDVFFKVLGFELLITGIIWVIGLVLSFGESTPSQGE